MDTGVVIAIVSSVVGPLIVAAVNWYLNNKSRQVKEIRLALLRLQITDETFPKSARILMYQEYKKLGGNGFIDGWVDRHILNKNEVAGDELRSNNI